MLNQQYTFRKQMQQLGRLVGAGTQMVMLTATLPPSEEDELFRRMYFDREQVTLLRARTTRTNIAYKVMKTSRTTKQEEVEAVVLKVVRQRVKRQVCDIRPFGAES